MSTTILNTTLANQQTFAFNLCNLLLKNNQPPVFLCVGDSHFVGDSLGPFVGHLLQTKYNIPYYVYGSLITNITKSKLLKYKNMLAKNHPNTTIVVVDSAIGDIENINQVVLKNGPSLLASLGNNPLKLGDISVSGITATTGINSLLFLKSTQLNTVMIQAEFIAKSISMALDIYSKLTQQNDVVKKINILISK